jgi:hypothetical protein
MSKYEQGQLARLGYRPADVTRETYDVRWDEPDHAGAGMGWLVAGAALVGIGALAWYSFGPDLIRYMKIRNM